MLHIWKDFTTFLTSFWWRTVLFRDGQVDSYVQLMIILLYSFLLNSFLLYLPLYTFGNDPQSSLCRFHASVQLKAQTASLQKRENIFKFGNKTSFLFPRREQQVINYFYLLTNTVRTTLSLSQNRSLTGYRWARLRVASNHTIHANAASADIGLPGLSCQENISFIVFAITRHALVAWWRGLKRLICKYKQMLFNLQ